MTGGDADARLPARWQTTLPDGRTAQVMARAQAINLLLDNDSPSFTFDPMGRLHGAFVEGINYRRSLDNRVLRKWSEHGEAGSTRRRSWLRQDEARAVVDLAYGLAAGAAERAGDAPPPIRDALRSVARWDWPRLEADRRRFETIYTPVGILPPDQYLALVLQATHGCSHNACTFCTFYRDIPFRIKSADEFRSHVTGVLDFFGPAIAMRRSIFLADANALVTPMPRLLALLHVLGESQSLRVSEGQASAAGSSRQMSTEPGAYNPSAPLPPAPPPSVHLPSAPPPSVHLPSAPLPPAPLLPAPLPLFAFIDAFHVERKSVADWQELQARSLQRVYIGMESGHDPLLRWLNKPGNAGDVLDAVTTLKAAGVSVSVIVMAGVGGAVFADAHVHDTVQLLNAMPLASGDLIYLSEFKEQPDSAYARQAYQFGVDTLALPAVREQAAAIRSQFVPRDPDHPPRFARYDIDEFIY
ncbi:MAG: hypothetical protein R2844_06890 [Caldilineales bacterium]